VLTLGGSEARGVGTVEIGVSAQDIQKGRLGEDSRPAAIQHLFRIDIKILCIILYTPQHPLPRRRSLRSRPLRKPSYYQPFAPNPRSHTLWFPQIFLCGEVYLLIGHRQDTCHGIRDLFGPERS